MLFRREIICYFVVFHPLHIENSCPLPKWTQHHSSLLANGSSSSLIYFLKSNATWSASLYWKFEIQCCELSWANMVCFILFPLFYVYCSPFLCLEILICCVITSMYVAQLPFGLYPPSVGLLCPGQVHSAQRRRVIVVGFSSLCFSLSQVTTLQYSTYCILVVIDM